MIEVAQATVLVQHICSPLVVRVLVQAGAGAAGVVPLAGLFQEPHQMVYSVDSGPIKLNELQCILYPHIMYIHPPHPHPHTPT